MAAIVKRSNGIYYQVTYLSGRKRIWRSTGARTKAEAKRVVADGLKSARTKPDLTVTQFLTQFLPYARTNFAPTTVELYEHSTKKFIRHLGDQLLLSYRPLDAERFIVGIDKIESYTPDKVEVDGVSIPIGRDYRHIMEHL